MRTKRLCILLFALALALLLPFVLSAQQRGGGVLLDGIAPASLDSGEIEGLLLMREEEKLARDLYLKLYEQWGIQVFGNIAESEQSHMDSLKRLFERYDLKDPVLDEGPASIGIFSSETMQSLYTDLLSQGQSSVSNAIVVGARVEELDIADLRTLIKETDNEDLKLVYNNLLKGSRNHLRAFDRQLRRSNIPFTPEHISQADYRAIIQGEQERGSY